MGKVFAVIGVVFFFVVGVLALQLTDFYNQEKTLRVNYEAKVEANQADFDNMWKTIAQVAQVSDQAKEGFKEVFTAYAEARSTGNAEGDGSLMKWTQEAVPGGTFDSSLYERVQTVVEAKREGWTSRQKELVDIKREHTTLISTLPGAFYNIFFQRTELELKLVTSSRTDKAFETGQDDDTDLYKQN